MVEASNGSKQKLRKAAKIALLESGPRKLRLKDIASAASMSSAGILYHYPDIDELVREIYEEAVDRWFEARREIVGLVSDPLERLSKIIDSGMPTSIEDASVRLLCELEAASVRNPGYALLMQDLFDRQVLLYEQTFNAAIEAGLVTSALSAQQLGRVAVALEDSLSYYILNGHRELDAEKSRKLVRDTLNALLQPSPAI